MDKKLSTQQKDLLRLISENRVNTLKTIKSQLLPNLYDNEGNAINTAKKVNSSDKLTDYLESTERLKHDKIERNKASASIHRSITRLVKDEILVKVDQYYLVHPRLLDE